jgi:hypothetical protein
VCYLLNLDIVITVYVMPSPVLQSVVPECLHFSLKVCRKTYPLVLSNMLKTSRGYDLINRRIYIKQLGKMPVTKDAKAG